MSNILNRTAEMLPGRWIKGSANDIDNNRCVLGHLNQATAWDHTDYTLGATAIDAIVREQYSDRIVNEQTSAIVQFNDHPDTTEAEVLSVLEKAAVRYDELYS